MLVLCLIVVEVSCSRGFYVRSLIRDIGIYLDSVAFVTKLKRTGQGPFLLDDCIKLVISISFNY